MEFRVKNLKAVEKAFFAVILSAAKNLTRSVILNEVKDLVSSFAEFTLSEILQSSRRSGTPQNDNSGSFPTAS